MNKLNFKHHLVEDNLTPEERATLISLPQHADIVIKPADKGGAVVVWDCKQTRGGKATLRQHLLQKTGP